MFSLDYLKEIAPSVVLAAVAILALTASATAQHQINDVNSNLVSAQLQLSESQQSIQAMTQKLQTLQEQYSNLALAAETAIASANATFILAMATKEASENFLSSKLNESLVIQTQIATLNASYPYPWTLESRMQQLDNTVNNKISDVYSGLAAANYTVAGFNSKLTLLTSDVNNQLVLVNNTFTSINNTLGDIKTKLSDEDSKLVSLAATPTFTVVGASGAAQFQNGWQVYNPNGNLYYAPGYSLKNGVVRLQGMAQGGSVNTVMFTLPAGYRPAYYRYYVVDTGYSGASTTIGELEVRQTGEVSLRSGYNSFASLDGVTFVASN